MKIKNLLLWLLPLAVLGSCKPIDPMRELQEYTDVVVYSLDTETNTGYGSDFASITVSNDLASSNFTLKFTDFKLAQDLPLRSSTVGGLNQLLNEEFDEYGEVTGYNYTFFTTQGQASYSGDLSVYDLRFGWLSTVFWGSFTSDSGRYRLWMLPREVQLYANRNTIVNMRGDSIRENAIHPRYDLEINVSAKTATLRGQGIMFTYSESEHKYFAINQLTIHNIPLEFTGSGMKAKAAKLNVSTGADQYELTDFEMRFDADFDGQRVAEYTLKRKGATEADDETIRVISYFDYFRKS